jgi:DNA-binding PadR family transcriptional regulator
MPVTFDQSVRIALYKEGWRSFKQLNAAIENFEAIWRALGPRRMQHKRNSAGQRSTRYYRLTNQGRAWARRWFPLLLEPFRFSREYELAALREVIEEDGWRALAFQYTFINPRLERHGLIEIAYFKTGLKNMPYCRVTPKGMRHFRKALRLEAERIRLNFGGRSRKPESRAEAKRQAAEWHKQRLANLDARSFVELASEIPPGFFKIYLDSAFPDNS